MTFLQRTRTIVAGLVAVLALAVWMALPASAVVPDRGDLTITGSASPNPVAGGGPVTLAVNVKNNSTVTANGVLVTVTVPQAAPAPQFVKCSSGVKGQACNESGGVITTTYATIKAHTAIKFSVTATVPGVSATFNIGAESHAASAIGGEEPRDGNATIAVVVVSATAPVVFRPGSRSGSLSCGDNITSELFQPGEDTLQLAASLGCAHSTVAVKISASGKTFDLQKFKILGAATNQIKGSVGILVAAGATNVKIVGGSTRSGSGLEYFDYCLMDGGGNNGLTVSNLRCFRGRSAGIDIVSDDVDLDTILVDLVVGGTTTTTTESPGGIGMHLSGRVNVKDSIVRRAHSIGIWADGSTVQIDGNLATSRVEASTGIGIQLDGASHQVNNTYVEGDGNDGVSTIGVLINGFGVSVDGLEVVDFGGNGFLVNGSNATIKRSTVEAVGGDSFVIGMNAAFAHLSGNGTSKGQKGFVVSGPDAFLDTNDAENVLGTGFEVSGPRAVMTGNMAKAGKADGYVLSGSGGNYNTNKAETNIGTAFAISGSNGTFLNNSCKGERNGGGFLVTGTNNTFNTNIAEANKLAEWVIASGNVDLGGNRKNGKTFQFTTAGGTFE